MIKYTKEKNRLEELDILRGFALFGIIVVNIFVFHAPYIYYFEFYGSFTGFQGSLIEGIIDFFAGNFMFIYAFLFGFGFYLLEERFKQKQLNFSGFYFRRMLLLALFGSVHILIFWYGDILLPYAFVGILLLFLTRFVNIPWLICIGVIVYFSFPLYTLLKQFYGLPPIFNEPVFDLAFFIETYQKGSFLEIFQLRMIEYFSIRNEKLLIYMPKELTLFIIGYVAAHFQILQKIRSQQVTFWLLLFAFLGLGFGWQFLGSFFLKETMSIEIFTKLLPLRIMLDQIFNVFVGLAYCMLIVLLCQTKTGLWLLYPLRFAGRMALTNYLMQSVICVFIFNSYGMGLYGTLTPVTLVIIALCIYLFQLFLSRLYLRYNEQGPMEMLWRRWSYGNALSKRRQTVISKLGG